MTEPDQTAEWSYLAEGVRERVVGLHVFAARL
jgi:hypothetical protein